MNQSINTTAPIYPAFPYTQDQLAWLTTMETTELPQGLGFLCTTKGYCCLGLALLAMGIPNIGEYLMGERTYIKTWSESEVPAPAASPKVVNSILPEYVAYRLKLRSPSGEFLVTTDMPYHIRTIGNPALIALNDDLGLSFRQIAAFIRQFPSAVFTNLEETSGFQDTTGENI